MSATQPAQSATPSLVVPVPAPTKQYGVYQHSDLTDPSGTSASLVAKAPDFTSAYTSLRTHAATEIEKHAFWNATYTRTSHNTYEIIDSDYTVRMRYSIETIHRSESKAEATWTRESSSRFAEDEFDAPREHWGLYIDINPSSSTSSSSASTKTQTFILGGFTCLGEANHAMKTSAKAYLTQHAGARLMERSIELVDEKGDVRQRYRIERGDG
jgi:hypothetical protein